MDNSASPSSSGAERRPFRVTEAHRIAAGQILESALSNHAAWERLALWTDTFGPRIAGSDALERAIDWALDELAREGFANVHGEPVMVPHWVRGEESATLIEPRRASLSMLGLGTSVGTPPEGITAPVLVVSSFAELEGRAAEAKGKIVLFDAPYVTYGETGAYRWHGASAAAKAGAVACLIRSVATDSIRSPHTGVMAYEEGVPRIPAAALSVEDAMLLHRLADRGMPVTVELRMQAKTLPDAPSRNLVAELPGSEIPDEVVIVSGHMDSWDVGTGAMDDAGGFMAAWHALHIIRDLGLKPRRTIRLVGWTSEEFGIQGGVAYGHAHAADAGQHAMAIESDAGFFRPTAISFAGDEADVPYMQEIAALLAPAGVFSAAAGGPGPDIEPLMRRGVPTLSLHSSGPKYMYYHHSHGDTADKVDPDEMAHAVAVLAIYAYILADMPGRVQGHPPAAG